MYCHLGHWCGLLTKAAHTQAYIDIQHTLVLGSPGTGKSTFMLYVEYKMLSDEPGVNVVCGYSMMESK